MRIRGRGNGCYRNSTAKSGKIKRRERGNGKTMSKQPHKSMTLEWRRVREYKGEKLWTDFKRKQKRQIKQPHHTRFPASAWRSGRFTINWQKDNTAGDRGANTLLDAHANTDHQWLKLNNGDILTCTLTFISIHQACRWVPTIPKNWLHSSCVSCAESFLYSSPHSLPSPSSLYVLVLYGITCTADSRP